MGATAFPLDWPVGKDRTSWRKVLSSRFDVTPGHAYAELKEELRRLGASQCVLSTNRPLKTNGQPKASAKEPDDSGVAVYFTYKGKPHCFACDRWRYVWENAWAIAKTIGALRGIKRWGTGDMLEAAMSGFRQLPAPSQWWDVLGVKPSATKAAIEKKYRALAFEHHPDQGGDPGKMANITSAIREARRAMAARE